MDRRTLLSLLLGLGVSSQVFAGTPLSPDNHDVYLAFFEDHASWQQWVAVGSSVVVSAATNSIVVAMHIDPSEESLVATVATSVTNGVAALSAERAAYLSANQAQPSAHVLNQFEIRRQQTIMAGVTQLMRGLKSSSWHGLHWYINWNVRVNGATLPRVGH